MQNILIGIKRFFKNKNTVTIIAVLVSLALLYVAYDWRITKATNPTSVVYAKSTIGPRTLITKDMVSTKKVPGELVEGIYQLSKDVVGKYVLSNAVIPKNGLFYKDYLGTWDDVSDSIQTFIEPGHTLFYLEVSKDSTYGNSIFPGNYIDLYFKSSNVTESPYNNKLVIGKFIESIKVLAVTDSSGHNVFETASNPGSPRYLIFSVDEELHLLLRKTNYAFPDSLFAVPRNKDYSLNPKPTKIVNSQIQSIILNKTYNIAEEDLDGTGGENND